MQPSLETSEFCKTSKYFRKVTVLTVQRFSTDELPVCWYDGTEADGGIACSRRRARDNTANFCEAGEGSCARSWAFRHIDDQVVTLSMAPSLAYAWWHPSFSMVL